MQAQHKQPAKSTTLSKINFQSAPSPHSLQKWSTTLPSSSSNFNREHDTKPSSSSQTKDVSRFQTSPHTELRNKFTESQRDYHNASWDISGIQYNGNTTLPANIMLNQESIVVGNGLMSEFGSPRLSEKLNKNLNMNMDLTETIMNGASKVITESIVKIGDKDLQTELQLGELKLNKLEEKLTQCLENSRRTLSMTELFSQARNGLLSTNEIIQLGSAIASPNRKFDTSSFDMGKKHTDNSIRSSGAAKVSNDEEMILDPEIKNKRSEKFIGQELNNNKRKNESILVEDHTNIVIAQKIDAAFNLSHDDSLKPRRNVRFQSGNFGLLKDKPKASSERNLFAKSGFAPGEQKELNQNSHRRNFSAANDSQSKHEGSLLIRDEQFEDGAENKKQASKSIFVSTKANKDYLDPNLNKESIKFIQSPADVPATPEFFANQILHRPRSSIRKENDFSFKDSLASPKGQKVKFLAPRAFEFEEESPKLENASTSSKCLKEVQLKEMYHGSLSSSPVKETFIQSFEQDFNKMKSNALLMNTSNDFKTIQELKDLLSSSQNLDVKIGSCVGSLSASIITQKDLSNYQTDVKHKRSPKVADIRIDLDEKRAKLTSWQEALPSNISKTKARRTGVHQRALSGNDVDMNFTKAFSVIKSKAVNKGDNFEERMKTDIYFRRRFEEDLSEFKKTLQPKITTQRASDLYNKLEQDARRRAQRVQHTELQQQYSNKKSARSQKSSERWSADNSPSREKVFERLVEDTKERLAEKEKRERDRQVKLEIEVETARGSTDRQSSKKLNKNEIHELVAKLTKDTCKKQRSIEKYKQLDGQEIRHKSTVTSPVSLNRKLNVESKVRQQIQDNRLKKRPVKLENSKHSIKDISIQTTQNKTPKKVRFSTEKSHAKPLREETRSALVNSNLNQNVIKGAVLKGIMKEVQSATTPRTKEGWAANLQYLRKLREDIDQIKSNIDEKINGIEKAGFGYSEQNQSPRLTPRKNANDEQKCSKSSNPSLERLHMGSPTLKIKNRYTNIRPSPTAAIEVLPNKERNLEAYQIPTKSPSSWKNILEARSISNMHSGKSVKPKDHLRSMKLAKVDQNIQELEATKQTFMSDVKAASYVDQLIKDFKEIRGVRSPVKRER